MKKLSLSLLLALFCGATWAQPATQADTRSDHLRTESVKADKPKSDLRLNINKASAAQLAKLPGVTDSHAKAIVKGRPYRSKEDLVAKKVLPQALYDEIKGNVYAGM